MKKGYSPVGGSEVLTYRLATNLAALGHNVRVLCQWPRSDRYGFPPPSTLALRHGSYRLFRHEGVEVYQLRPRLGPLGQQLDVLATFDLLRYGVAKELAGRCDIVHNVCREYTGYAVRLARKAVARLVMTPLPHPGQFWGGERPADFANYRQADALIAPTDAEKAWYVARGIAPEKVAVIGLGPNIDAPGDGEAFRRRFGLAGPLVLFVGRKEPYKGVRPLVQAMPLVWQRHPQTHFAFIGEDSILGALDNPLRGLTDRRVLNLPILSGEETAAAFAACDVFCLASRHETFGLVYAEAWLCGKPVIGGDIPTLRDVITEGVDGFVVKQKPEAVAEAIIRLLDDPELRARLGEAGRRKVETRYNWRTAARQTEALYERLLANAPASALQPAL